VTEIFSSELSSETSEAWNALLAGVAAPNKTDAVTTALFELYGPIATPKKTPFVIGQMGQSLDGFIATLSGDSHYINGPESLLHLHRLRALCDAVVVGWRTVEADNPQLTTRHAAGENPLRVVIDLVGRLDSDRNAFGTDAPGALRITGEMVSCTEGRADPRAVIDLLAQRGCKRILIEGGGLLVSNFLSAGLLDRLHVAVAPLILGEGRRGIAIPPASSLKAALKPKSRNYQMGVDILFDLDLRQS
jgi:diaminohydroxyphosphoribosylaminopyrimidine deaminase/5-amino-6-(5-phosphoribosylamino)uracil reductase